MPIRLLAGVRTLVALILLAGGAAAEGPVQPAPLSLGTPQLAVVVLDRDALFARSLFGQRVAKDIETASSELAAENRRIEEQLEAEEMALTAQREAMDVGAFRDLAADFDARVVAIRRAQDAKARAIQQQSERAQSVFLEEANPILIALAREIGALVILDRRIVIASADQVDITATALERIDQAIGAGDGLAGPQPTQRPARPPVPLDGDTAEPQVPAAD